MEGNLNNFTEKSKRNVNGIASELEGEIAHLIDIQRLLNKLGHLPEVRGRSPCMTLGPLQGTVV